MTRNKKQINEANWKASKYIDPKGTLLADLMENKFHIGWHGEKNYNDDQFLIKHPSAKIDENIYRIIPTEVDWWLMDEVKDDEVIYKYNNEYFRSDDFITTHNGKHIVFSGCSETEGVGGNIEEAWCKILYDKISENEKCSGFFNLSGAGWGYLRILTNLFIYFEKYGKPDYIFILLPNFSRKFDLVNSDNTINTYPKKDVRYVQKYFNINNKKVYDSTGKVVNVEIGIDEYYLDFINFSYMWKNFVSFCKLNNIKLFATSWAFMDRINIYNLGIFDNFFNYDDDYAYHLAVKKYKPKEMIKKAKKRDGHHGVIFHELWADLFYRKYLENIND